MVTKLAESIIQYAIILRALRQNSALRFVYLHNAQGQGYQQFTLPGQTAT